MTNQHADQHADAEKYEVGDFCSADLIANFWLHAIEVGWTAGEVQFIARFQLKLVQQWQIQSHALDRRQENAMAGVSVDLIVDLANFAAR